MYLLQLLITVYGCFQAAVHYGLNINVTEIIYTWIKQPGFPMVTFTRSLDGSTVTVTQEHFLINPDTTPSEKYPATYK